MQATWLHVSDFHLRGGDPYDRDVVLGALVSSVREMRERGGRKPDLIFATGDIAFSGKPHEYEAATVFFDALLDAAGVERSQLFVIPGNHDVDRDLGIGLARTLGTREEADAYFRPETPKGHITQKLGAFKRWHDAYFAGIRAMPEGSTCGPVEAVEVGGGKIGLLPLNSALFCQDEYDHAKLMIGRRSLEAALKELRALNADLNVALVHHPLDWLSDIERTNIKASLLDGIDVILRGHLHETEVENVVSASSGALHLAAGAAYQTRRWPNRAIYATFDGRDLKVFPIRFEDSPRELWTVDPSLFPYEPGNEHTFRIPRFQSAEARAAAPALAAPAPATTPRFRSNIPPRHNLPFVGRDALLDEMLAALGDPSTEAALVLHGQPGVGKSELAREFARRHRNRYPGGTFFVSAGGGAELVDLARIGATVLDLEFPPGFSLHDQCERTLLSLGTAPVLLIYDNAVSPEAIKPWLPPAGMPCHVLITSLSEHWGPRWQLIEVEPLPRDHSLELIERLAGKEVAERYGEKLATMADGLPIQLCPTAEMIAYEARRGRLDSVELSLAREAQESFQLVYERLEPSLRLLLHAAAFLNPQRIPREELARELTLGAEWSESEFRSALDGCLDLHLLEGLSELRMHQLLASFLSGTPMTGGDAACLQRIRELQWNRLLELAGEIGTNPASSELAAEMMAFQLNPENWGNFHSSFSTENGEIIGRALVELGEFRAALPWFRNSADEKHRVVVHGAIDHASLGRSLHAVGYCLSGMGEYNEARLWYERAVAEAQQGDLDGRVNHAHLGESLHQIGYCLSRMGKYHDARLWYERAVKEKQASAMHGQVDHESLGASLHAVGISLRRISEYKKARVWFERALRETQQGDMHGRINHEGLSKCLHAIGECLLHAGKYEEAQPMYERAVEAARQGDVHGRIDHDSLSRSLYAVGSCLFRTGDYEEAQHWFESAIEAAQQGNVHGRVDHNSLGIRYDAVGYSLSHVGKYEEARTWFERAVGAKRQGNLFGRIDRDSLKESLMTGAQCLRKIGRVEEAEAWEAEVAALAAEMAQAEGT